jgi:hypothetical protein
MRTGCTRALATLLTTLMVAGCGPQTKPFPAKTPEQLKQLTEVTDRVLLLVGSAERGPAMRQAIEALGAAREQYQQHSDAIVNQTNAEAISCIGSQAIEIMDFETSLAKLEEAAQRQDEIMTKRRTTLLRLLTGDAVQCAILSTIHLAEHEKRPEALKHGAVLISQIYAIAAIYHAATDRRPGWVLKDQIRAYEIILTKLGPRHEAPVVTDALPKLKAALASLAEPGR